MAQKRDRTGEHYGHWIVRKQDIEKTKATGNVYWDCECDCGCGTHKSIRTDALKEVIIGGCNNMLSSKPIICEKCGNTFYPKKQAKKRKYCYNCLPLENYDGNEFRKIVKSWALQYKRNSCCICGYNKCQDALEFHHKDPSQKDFCLSDRDLTTSWDIIKKELDKCIVVCSNCHREIHAGLIKEIKNE